MGWKEPLNKFSKAEIRQKYNEFAFSYDKSEFVGELLLGGLRKKLFENVSGKVLEVGVGTGKNLKYYPRGCEITAIDFSQEMIGIAKNGEGRNVDFKIMDVENLEFQENEFDYVVDSLGLCTFPDPIRALNEMSRVCKPEGKVLLLEHGRSLNRLVNWWLDYRCESHYQKLGCNCNLDFVEIVEGVGLQIDGIDRNFFGIFYQIYAHPL